MITLRDITLRRGVRVVLQGASVTLAPGRLVEAGPALLTTGGAVANTGARKDLIGEEQIAAHVHGGAIPEPAGHRRERRGYWRPASIREQIARLVEEHHQSFPLRRGIPREELKSKLKVTPRIFNAVLARMGAERSIVDHASTISLPGHEIRFTAGEQATLEKMKRKFEANPFSPPSVKDCQAEVGEDVLNALIELGEFMPVSADVIFRASDYDSMKEKIKRSIETHGKISLAEVRDTFNTSRKYAQALLEHFDAIGFTKRDGDFRKLRN